MLLSILVGLSRIYLIIFFFHKPWDLLLPYDVPIASPAHLKGSADRCFPPSWQKCPAASLYIGTVGGKKAPSAHQDPNNIWDPATGVGNTVYAATLLMIFTPIRNDHA